MTGGLIQLVAYGVEDLFLTRDPQITFFKIVYRRHTNFSTEPIPQKFIQPINFGRKSTCVISRQGDLINQIYLVITLPAILHLFEDINNRNNHLTLFAWVRKIGFAIIKNFEVVIGGELIDRQYGEWLNIWYELMGPRGSRNYGFEKMIGDVPELIEFSYQKDEYTLYVPLQFWFCRNSGSALPLINLQYSEVKINVELSEAEKCYLTTPTHYITVINDLVNFKPFEYIEQRIDDQIASGIFTHFDIMTKRLYYMKTSRYDFQTLKHNFSINQFSNNLPTNPMELKYLIRGINSGTVVIGMPNTSPQLSAIPIIKINIDKCFLLVDYIFLDEEERIRFLRTKSDYLIEQVSIINQQTIEGQNALIDIDLTQPCKFLVWMAQLKYIYDRNNMFNYTDGYELPYFRNKSLVNKSLVNKSLVLDETLLINGRDRLSFREYSYFNYVQPYQSFPYGLQEGINVYSFSLFPDKFQPSGSCNMSLMDNIQIRLRLSSQISIKNKALFRGYALTYNILRVVNGLSGLVFV